MRKATIAVALTIPLIIPMAAAGPAAAESTVKQSKLQRNIKRGFKDKANISVTVNCPANVTWQRGKVFYCKAKTKSGSKYRVQVTLGSESKGRLRWKVVA